MSSINLATWLKIIFLNAFFEINRYNKVLNELPTHKRQQDDYYAIHMSTTRKKNVFQKVFFMCVTRPDLSGVSLRYDFE